MDKRRYQAIGNNYVCMALDAQTVTDCVRGYLATGKKKLSQALIQEMDALLKWAKKATIGEFLIKDEYTVRVLDADVIREESKKNRI